MSSGLIYCLSGLASELLTNRYKMYPAIEPGCLLARHEQGVFAEARAKIASMPRGHRSPEFDRHLLPRCGQLIEAVGQRMAYEAAKSSGLDPAIFEFFEISCIMSDSSWYIENAGLKRSELVDRQTSALQKVLPFLPQLLDEPCVGAYVTVPIVDEKATEEYLVGLPTFEHGVRQRSQRVECERAKL